MKLKSFSRLFLVAFLVAAFSPNGQSGPTGRIPGEKLVRFVIQLPSANLGQTAQLSQALSRGGYDVAGTNWKEGKVEVITTEEGIKALQARGLTGSRVTSRSGAVGPDPRYLNPERLEAKFKALAQAYPQFTRLEVIGKTHQGRPILALLVSDTPNPSDPKALQKPSIIFDGLHHAREVMTPEIVVDVGETLLRSMSVSRRARQIVNRWQIWLVPMMNPDGSNIVFTSHAMWRKNARADGNDIHGVDLNRNYSYRWSACNGSSGSKNSDTYRGPSAGSEPEVQAVMNLGARVRPTASLSYHSYSELVLTPLGCRGDYSSEKEMVKRIAGELAGKLPADNGRGNYTPGTPWELLYAVDGDSMDFYYAAFGTLAYTFEVNQDFQPPYTLREPTLKKHRIAWGYFLERIDQNLLTMTVIDERTGKPVEAIIGINTIQHGKGELPLKTNAVGKFFKVLDPGTYSVGAKLADGRAAVMQIQMAGKPQEHILVVK